MDLTRCSDKIFLFVNYIWWFPSSSVAGFWILRSQAELAAWPYDFRRVPALRENPVNPMGCFLEGWRKMSKKRWLFFFSINDERFMGFFDVFFFEHFIYIYIYMCRFYMFLYVFKYVYMCFFFHLEKWEKRPQEVLFGSSKKRPKTWRMAPLGVICKFEVSFLHPRNLR